MQSDEIEQKRIVADFLIAARRYFGLEQVAPPARSARPFVQLRPMLRSLLVVGSLGTVLGQPVFAMETMRSVSEPNMTSSASRCESGAVAASSLVELSDKTSKN